VTRITGYNKELIMQFGIGEQCYNMAEDYVRSFGKQMCDKLVQVNAAEMVEGYYKLWNNFCIYTHSV